MHERALKFIYQDSCNFNVLLEKYYGFLIYQRNLQVLMTEICKTVINVIALPPSHLYYIMNSL